MSPAPSLTLSLNLAQNEGQWLFSAPEALLKGALEAEMEIGLIAGPRSGPFADFFELATMASTGMGAAGTPASIVQLLRQHSMRVAAVPDAGRALALVAQTARSGKAGVALVPNDQLDESIASIRAALQVSLDRGGAMCIVMDDNPRECPASCPRQAAQRLGIPCIEPGDVSQLRDAVEHGLRLSRADRSPVGIIVHQSISQSSDTLEANPNRVLGFVEAMLARRKRHRATRWTESGGALRMARRLELNRFRAMPSPGESVAVGFVTVGPADQSLIHLTNTLGLHGRVPVLQLGLVHPVDESAAARMLNRCQKVIVLEPRPGVVESRLVGVAESMRKRGEQPGTVWGRTLPPDDNGIEHSMQTDADLHPSVLVRRISHVLHAIRPTVQVASQLLPQQSGLQITVPSRTALVGENAALIAIRRILTDVDQWLRERAPLEERGIAPTALAIDGAEAPGVSDRVVNVETWEHRRFQHEGIAALVHASREDRPWVMIACESASEEIRDLERLARGAVPAERADRVTLEIANFSDRVALRDTIREAVMTDRLTVIIVRDGPPARYDPAAIESAPGGLAEVDRLGFEPLQRLVRSIDEVCALRQSPDEQAEEHRVDHDPSPLQHEVTVDEVSKRVGSGLVLRVRPLLEEVEVVRTRPPVRSWRGADAARITTPQPMHARQSLWRAHIAGFRREPPGVAAWVLCQAGRSMGYHVRSLHDAIPIGPGRRAWTQILFTRPREHEGAPAIAAAIPYGEADLLLGLDPKEALRAINPAAELRVAFADRTHVVANVGRFGDELESESGAPSSEHIGAALGAVCHASPRLIDDFAAACRTWFHTDRVTDMALLGAAFQLGLIPVSPEAIEAAVNLAEARGVGRSRETFEFGRRLAVNSRLFSRPRDDREENVDRLARRVVLSLSRGAWGGGKRAESFSALMRQSLAAMPGLAETDAGRIARRDFVSACHRCRIWGGFEYAHEYAELISRLYQADRGDTGRALTRNAILPLAEVMLIRDPLYIAGVTTSSEQRRRLRQRLNVRMARGDRVERRYLTRFELVAFSKRVRADVRTSDWPARFGSWMRQLIPVRWRGTRRERELRGYLMTCVRRATEGAARDYDHWVEALQRLHNQAAENRLRGMALAEVNMLVDSHAPASITEAHHAAAASAPGS